MRRVAALLTGALAGLVTFELATSGHVQGYGIALVGTVATGTVLSAVRLWGAAACTADLRMAIGLLAGLVLAGQVLVSWLGVPGLAAAHWTTTGVVVVVLATVVLLLVASAALAPRTSEEGRLHPYAL
jgi:hypothetical protein